MSAAAAAAPIDRACAERLGELLRLLAHPNRLLIVSSLAAGERSVAGLEDGLGIRQPSLSQHLGALREAGVVAARREAKSVFYALADPRAARLVRLLPGLCGDPAAGEAPARVPTAAAPPSRPVIEAAVFAIVPGPTVRGGGR